MPAKLLLDEDVDVRLADWLIRLGHDVVTVSGLGQSLRIRETGMTEAEWFKCDDPKKLREASRASASDRKDRIFLAAHWHWHGERLKSEQLLGNARIAAEWAERGAFPIPLYIEGMSIMEDGEPVRDQVDHVVSRTDSLLDAESIAFYVSIILDIYGNPFRQGTLNSLHRTRTVVSLAHGVYDECRVPTCELDLDSLAVLADALEEMGAPDELVAHLRSPGPHVRGCWAVDYCCGLS